MDTGPSCRARCRKDLYFQARDDLDLSTSILLPRLEKTFWHATKSDVPRLEGF
jgi:hypothetical protein